MFKVEDKGFHIQLVDTGRRFCQMSGYTQSGAMDWVSYSLANALVDNPLDCYHDKPSHVALECIGSIQLRAGYEAILSVCGAAESVYVDETEHAVNTPLVIKQGQRLRVSPSQMGMRLYIAFYGGIKAPRFFGSSCDVSKEKTGGLFEQGAGLRKGDAFDLISKLDLAITNKWQKQRSAHLEKMTHRVNQYLAQTNVFSREIPCILSYQDSLFSVAQKSMFFGSEYTVTPQNGRMGIRLSGSPLHYKNKSLLSEGISNGSIQVAGDGMPMVLMADRQTIGGYPKIGVAGGYGLARLGQLKTGDKISFIPSDIESCRQQYLMSHQLLGQFWH
ncbi:5-oxoprolinase subunit C family protein [Agaribacter flavus]|uniref:Biotin-dependent carboxyltransferase family protein n=1 Tax=Agaribacter flavus TaxID=1902781 RepID=A0ABV7FT00_9ALTE